MRMKSSESRAAATLAIAITLAVVPFALARAVNIIMPPVTSTVAVAGNAVSATITPSANDVVDAAEYFLDTTGNAGTGTALTLSGTAGVVSATGTLPTLTLGSAHTVYVHGSALNSTPKWGDFASASFTVSATAITIPLAVATLTLSDRTYLINLTPSDPITPGEPMRVRSRFGDWNAADTLGYSRTTVTAADGTFSLYSREMFRGIPSEPIRDFLIGFVATNGLKYSADTNELLTTYTPK